MIQKLAKPLKFAGIGTAALSIILCFIDFGKVEWYEKVTKRVYTYYYYEYKNTARYFARIIDCKLVGTIFFIFACLLFIYSLLMIIIKKMNKKPFTIIFASLAIVTSILGVLTSIFDTLYIVDKWNYLPTNITSFSPYKLGVAYFKNRYVLHTIFSLSTLLLGYSIFSLIANIKEKNQGNSIVCPNCFNQIITNQKVMFCSKCGYRFNNEVKTVNNEYINQSYHEYQRNNIQNQVNTTPKVSTISEVKNKSNNKIYILSLIFMVVSYFIILMDSPLFTMFNISAFASIHSTNEQMRIICILLRISALLLAIASFILQFFIKNDHKTFKLIILILGIVQIVMFIFFLIGISNYYYINYDNYPIYHGYYYYFY